MTYESARGALKDLLAPVAISDPATMTVKKVYEDPPGSIADLPCFILYGSAGGAGHVIGGDGVTERHTERVRFLLVDSDLDRAARLVRAFRKATLTALKSAGGLGGFATVQGVEWEEPSSFVYASKPHTGYDLLITFHVKAP